MKALFVLLFSVALAAQSLPDKMLTPGVVTTLTQSQVCSTKWGLDRRHVTAAMKKQVEASYHVKVVVAQGKGPCCEIDHKVPRELGGADDVSNLWPQPWIEAKKKDAEENAYHKQVCSGATTLAEAQRYFMHWGEK
jgi:hypothetical protein